MIVTAIVVAAGSGQRLGAAEPKAFVQLAGHTLLEYAVRPFLAHHGIRDLVVVAPQTYLSQAAALVPTAHVVAGGQQRQDSVRAGLHVLADDVDVVLVHDVARAFTPMSVIDRVLTALADGADAVIPVRPVVDTVKRISGDVVVETVPRDDLRAVQTPQGFRLAQLRSAHLLRSSVTDDAALIEAMGLAVHVVDGADEAFKITQPWDVMVAQSFIAQADPAQLEGTKLEGTKLEGTKIEQQVGVAR